MGLFAKPEYETVILDYRAAVTDDFPCIEAYGDVLKICQCMMTDALTN